MASRSTSSAPAGDTTEGVDPLSLFDGSHGPRYPGVSPEQRKALRAYFKRAGLGHYAQMQVVKAVIDRSIGRDGPISVQETTDLASETYNNIEQPTAQERQFSSSPSPAPQSAKPAPQEQPPATDPNPSATQAFSDAVDAHTTQSDISQGQWDEMSAALGYDAKAAYQHQVDQYKQASQQARAHGETPPPPPTSSQWLASTRQSMEGGFGSILDQLAGDWEMAHNTPMPHELRQKILDQLNATPSDLKGRLLTAIANQPGASVTTMNAAQSAAESEISAIVKQYENTTVSTYAGEHITATDVGATAADELGKVLDSRVREYINNFGNRPLPPDAKDWGNLTKSQWQDLIDNHPYKLGMSKKQYDAAYSQINSQWQSAFGVPASDSVIEWARGKSQDEVTRFIDSQPSRVHGMNVGQYNGIVKSGDSISNDLWGHPMDDHMVSLIWGHLSKDNPRSTPPAPTLQGTAQDPNPVPAATPKPTPTQPFGSATASPGTGAQPQPKAAA